jgi:predicted phosphoribosyltransferase
VARSETSAYLYTISILPRKGGKEMQFIDRQSAGKTLARKLHKYLTDKTVVVALPPGGVILGFEVTKSLDVPLGLVLARKIGHPASSEHAIAAVAEGVLPIYNESGLMPVDDLWLKAAEARTRRLIEHQRRLYFTHNYSPPAIPGSRVVLVSDGMATGLTMQAAVYAVRRMHPSKIIVAVPVASDESIELIEPLVNKVVVLDKPRNFLGMVRSHYHHFPYINDMTVRQLLERSSTYGIRIRATTHP